LTAQIKIHKKLEIQFSLFKKNGFLSLTILRTKIEEKTTVITDLVFSFFPK